MQKIKNTRLKNKSINVENDKALNIELTITLFVKWCWPVESIPELAGAGRGAAGGRGGGTPPGTTGLSCPETKLLSMSCAQWKLMCFFY